MHHDDNFRTSSSPKLVKALGHLTTPISTLRFNHDAQILAMASKDKKDAMRLVCYYFLAFGFFFVTLLLHGFPFLGQPYDFSQIHFPQWPKIESDFRRS